MKKVLVIEDNDLIQQLIERFLHRNGLEAIPAFTLEQAEQQFFVLQSELLMILVDGSVETNDNRLPDTPPLVQKFRHTFNRPIIAISANERSNEILLQAGCTHYGQKPDIFEAISSALIDARLYLNK